MREMAQATLDKQSMSYRSTWPNPGGYSNVVCVWLNARCVRDDTCLQIVALFRGEEALNEFFGELKCLGLRRAGGMG